MGGGHLARRILPWRAGRPPPDQDHDSLNLSASLSAGYSESVADHQAGFLFSCPRAGLQCGIYLVEPTPSDEVITGL